MRKRLLYASSPQWETLGRRIDLLIKGREFRPLKETKRTHAGLIAVADSPPVFVKCVESGSWLKGMLVRIFGSRARRALTGAALLEASGFARPRLLAASETLSAGAIRTSCIVTEALTDARMMSVFALSGGRDFERRKRVGEVVAREVRRLHDAGIYTRDLQETNVMLEAAGNHLKVYFVDREDFRRVQRVSERRRMLNLVHLDRSIGRFVSRTHRLRFLYNYLGEKPVGGEARSVVRRILAMRARIDSRNRKRGRASLKLPDAPRSVRSGSGSPDSLTVRAYDD